MKKMTIGIFALILFLSYGVALAGNGALSGPHWQFNLIGHPKGISGDDSNGRAIMVPLGEKKVNKNSELPCTLDGNDQFYYEEDEAGSNIAGINAYILKGVKLIFEPTTDPNGFEILDRDATDGEARIRVPDTTGQDVVDGVDVFIRILGKPYTCMQIDGVAYDADQADTGVWYYSGHVTLNRKPGRNTFENINDLFDVWYCDEWTQDQDTTSPTYGEWTCTGNNVELSVFDSVFEEYFWDIQNYGTRIVQVRLYPRAYQPSN